MTRKDFELIAEVLRELRRTSDDGQVSVNRVVVEFTIALARSGGNGNFDRDRFSRATQLRQ